MKKLAQTYVAGSLLTIIALFLSLTVPGCATITGDPVLVRAEQFIDSTMETINTFLEFEETNRALIDDDGCAKFANKLRKEAPAAFESYMAILDAYEANRTPENKLKLEGAMEILDAMKREALVLANKHGKKSAMPGTFELVMAAMAGISSLIKLIGEYKRVASQTEEWTAKEKKLFRDKWQRIMGEASHWKTE